MVNLSILKRLDLFAQPVRLRTSWDNSSKYSMFYGSWTGTLFTLMSYSVCLGYFSYLHNRMTDTVEDTYASNSMRNSFNEEYN